MQKELLITTVDGSVFRGYHVILENNPIEDIFPEDLDAISIRLTEAVGPYEENQLVFLQQTQIISVALVKQC